MFRDRIKDEAVLLLDERGDLLGNLGSQLHAQGCSQIYRVNDRERVVPVMSNLPISVVVAGLRSVDENTLDLLKQVLQLRPGVKLFIVSTLDDRESAVACLRLGALDYQVVPVDVERLLRNLQQGKAGEQRGDQRTTAAGRASPRPDTLPLPLQKIVTRDRKMLSIFRYIEAVAETTQTVLITGETGTGKELVARAIHDLSGRTGDFVTVNAAGLDDIMFTDTLFGHDRGAFTGAERERKGLIEKAATGTLLLDEIGDLSSSSQVKLLRILQNGEYYPLGSDQLKISHARIVVATNSVLDERLKEGSFRTDLYYRLCSHHLSLPALRERSGDIPLLVNYFAQQEAEALGRSVPKPTAETLSMLAAYDFPGNIRELQGMVNNAVALATAGSFSIVGKRPATPARRIGVFQPPPAIAGLDEAGGRLPTLKEAEDYLIRQAVTLADGNQQAAAAMLGISRQALNKRLLRNPSYIKEK